MTPAVTPLLIGPKNAEAMTGLAWRLVRDQARELGIEPVRVGRRLAVPAARFLAALEGQNAKPEAAQAPADTAAALRERLGLRLAGGGK